LIDQKRLSAEIDQLLIDIRRIGPTHPPPSPKVLFGELFEDDEVQQYYEALVGTLKSAKKRGMINFKGQMLLKGMHDQVVISIVGEAEGDDDQQTEPNKLLYTKPVSRPPRAFTFHNTSTTSFSHNLGAKKKTDKHTIREKPPSEIGCTYSDSEPVQETEDDEENVFNIGIVSDSEMEPVVLKSPRRRCRLVVPSIFLDEEANKFGFKNGRPAPPSSFRRTSPRHAKASPRKPLVWKRWNEQEVKSQVSKPHFDLSKSNTSSKQESITKVPARASRASKASVSPPMKSMPIKNHSGEAASRVEDEVHRLLVDIRRIGNGPSVTFGQLFEDDEVQNTYEALVGTLRSAKRQGLIDFKGQMLLKGMHDNVEIRVVE
jgi:hypothetical protein